MYEKDLYEKIIHIVDVNIIFCLLPCILSLMLISRVFRNKAKTKKVLNIIRWIIIVYSIITAAHFIIGIITAPEEYAFTRRAIGPYKFVYWFILMCALVLPFTLLIKKLASKYLYVLLIAILMKIGLYFERFVIIVTSIHRDYLPPDNSPLDLGILIFLAVMLLQGFILALLLLGIVEVIERGKAQQGISKQKN